MKVREGGVEREGELGLYKVVFFLETITCNSYMYKKEGGPTAIIEAATAVKGERGYY